MIKTYIGKNRIQNLDWLVNVWLKEGPPVCFLQGFSGVGKTDLARDFRDLAEKQGKWHHAVINEIADRATPSVIECMMELSMLLSGQGLPEMEEVLFGQINPNLGFALEKALRRPVVIILDEAQRFFHKKSGAPLPEMNGILTFLRNRPELPGRLLLLSDRLVEEARWSEWIPKRTLTKLEPDEAIEAFDTKLKEAGFTVEIPQGRKREVLHDLDFTPRAIEALVAALRHESLDEIIESNPGLWAVRDRVVSREFLNALERDLLERTMRHLDEDHRRKLWRLAVHRRNFKREAIEQFCQTKDEATDLRNIFLTRFLLNFHRGVHELNPIVREISLAHLRDNPAEFRQAHSAAADYHMRHFKAKQVVGSHGKLGDSFAELRYHLVQAGRQGELQVIGDRFTQHLKQEIKATTPVPIDREELDERIGVLTVLLGNGGAKGLEYHLARCLERRQKSGDLEQAVIHAGRALGPGAPVASWELCARLVYQVSGLESAIKVLNQARGFVSAESNLFVIFQLGADLLGKAGKTDEAVALLKDGIKVIPPDKSLFSLYESCADLLGKTGKIDEAVALLKDGIKVIPPDKSLFSLYQKLGELFCQSEKPAEAIAELREGLRRIPEAFNRYKLAEATLYLCAASGDARTLSEILAATGSDAVSRQQAALGRVLQLQAQGRWHDAGEAAVTARRDFPSYFPLASCEAFSRLAAGDADAAWQALAAYPMLTFPSGSSRNWLPALIHLRRGSRPEASIRLAGYLGRPVEESRELNESFLLRLWDEQEPSPDNMRLCFHFPFMPASLSGLSHDVRRLPFAPPVLAAQVPPNPIAVPTLEPTAPAARQLRVLAVATEWQSGHGGLSTLNRQLCCALAAAGAGVGCVVLKASGSERRTAQTAGVTLIEATSTPGLLEQFALARKPALPPGFVPDVIIGHGRVTGPAAQILQTDHFPAAKRLHFIHMAPDEIEWFKLDRGDDAGVRAEERTEIERNLGKTAARVIAVGPRLHQRALNDFYPFGIPDPVRLDPGFDAENAVSRKPPPGQPLKVLVLGRMEDSHLKGLDLAARAVGLAASRRGEIVAPIELVVRGAPEGSSEHVRTAVRNWAEFPALGVVVPPYTADTERLDADLRRASLVLMPSRTEGFGLVGLEAIVAGTPVLVSDQSGLGALLRGVLEPEQASRFVVRMSGDDDRDRDEWGRAIEAVLRDREAAFHRAEELRTELGKRKTWAVAITGFLEELGLRGQSAFASASGL